MHACLFAGDHGTDTPTRPDPVVHDLRPPCSDVSRAAPRYTNYRMLHRSRQLRPSRPPAVPRDGDGDEGRGEVALHVGPRRVRLARAARARRQRRHAELGEAPRRAPQPPPEPGPAPARAAAEPDDVHLAAAGQAEGGVRGGGGGAAWHDHGARGWRRSFFPHCLFCCAALLSSLSCFSAVRVCI